MKVPELHFSMLKQFARSPAHFKAFVEEGFASSRAMGKGTLVHALVLGGDYVLYEKDRRGNAWKEFAEANKGRFIVTQKELTEAQRIADAVMANPVAAPLLIGDPEREWKATMHNRLCGGRIDVSGIGHTTDLKTTNDAEPFRFSKACLRMGFHAQLAWYQDARRALGEDPGEAWIVGVESKSPYAVTVLRVTERALEEGRKLTRLWIERLIGCELSDEWPGYVQSAIDLDIAEDSGLIIDGELLSMEAA